MLKQSLFIGAILFASSAFAATVLGEDKPPKIVASFYQVTQCETGRGDVGVFVKMNQRPSDGTPVTFVEAENKPTHAEPNMDKGKLKASSAEGYGVQLPIYWPGEKEILPTQCKSQSTRPWGTIVRDIIDVRTYFIYDLVDIKPGETYEDLVQQGKAIPLKMKVLCVYEVGSQLPNGCKEIHILDQIIPIP